MPGLLNRLGSRKSRNSKTEKDTVELLASNNRKYYSTLVYYTSNKNIH